MMEWLSDNAGLIGLLSFFAAFCGIMVWVLHPRMKQKLEAKKYIPLEDDHDHNA